MKLSIVIPSYNEERTIAGVLDAVLAVELRDQNGSEIDRELIVIDDGSHDHTREILARYDDRPEVRVILHERNRGKGRHCARGSRR
jgi:glycosyltransferase involved in cell wall biosynthesis